MVDIWYTARYTLWREVRMGDNLTVKQAAERMGRSIRLVNRFCKDGRLKAERFGNAWMIRPADLAAFMTLDRPTGATGHRNRKSTAKKPAKRKK